MPSVASADLQSVCPNRVPGLRLRWTNLSTESRTVLVNFCPNCRARMFESLRTASLAVLVSIGNYDLTLSRLRNFLGYNNNAILSA